MGGRITIVARRMLKMAVLRTRILERLVRVRHTDERERFATARVLPPKATGRCYNRSSTSARRCGY